MRRPAEHSRIAPQTGPFPPRLPSARDGSEWLCVAPGRQRERARGPLPVRHLLEEYRPADAGGDQPTQPTRSATRSRRASTSEALRT